MVTNGNTITAVSASCSDALLNACATLGLGSLGTITLNAGVLPTTGGVASISAGGNVLGGGSALTAAPTPSTAVVSTTRLSTSCGLNLLGVNVCATIAVPGVASVNVKREATTLATVVRK
jgi:hypothetical protein